MRKYLGPKRVLLLAIYAGVALYAWHLHAAGVLDPENVRKWVSEYPAASVLLFLLAYAVCVIATLPTLPFNLVAGILWGPIGGGLLSALAASAGAVIAFVAARTLLGQPLAKHYSSSAITWLQGEFDREGWRFIAFVRINPVFPTGLLNYLLGMTSVALAPYTWATILFILPPSLLVAWLGHTVGTAVIAGRAADIWHVVLGVSAAVSLLVLLRYLSRFITHQRNAR